MVDLGRGYMAYRFYQCVVKKPTQFLDTNHSRYWKWDRDHFQTVNNTYGEFYNINESAGDSKEIKLDNKEENDDLNVKDSEHLERINKMTSRKPYTPWSTSNAEYGKQVEIGKPAKAGICQARNDFDKGIIPRFSADIGNPVVQKNDSSENVLLKNGESDTQASAARLAPAVRKGLPSRGPARRFMQEQCGRLLDNIQALRGVKDTPEGRVQVLTLDDSKEEEQDKSGNLPTENDCNADDVPHSVSSSASSRSQHE